MAWQNNRRTQAVPSSLLMRLRSVLPTTFRRRLLAQAVGDQQCSATMLPSAPALVAAPLSAALPNRKPGTSKGAAPA